MLNAAVFWLGYSGITYAAARFMFDGDGGYATVLRVAGFAYPTLLLLLVTGSGVQQPLSPSWSPPSGSS